MRGRDWFALAVLTLIACGQPKARTTETGQVPTPAETTRAPDPQVPSPPRDTTITKPAPAGSTADSTRAGLRARLDALIGDARCRTASDCRLIGIGAKPCGGPRTYRVYSITQTDSVTLAGVATAIAELERTENTRLGRMGDCQAVTPPTIRVVDGRCTIAP